MGEVDRFRAGKSYSVAEVARYSETTPATVRRWISGYDYRDRHMEPVFSDKSGAEGEPIRLSFLDLAEIVVAVRFTKQGGALEKVRAARRRALHQYPELQYPFASLRLRRIGGEILHYIDEELGGKALALSLGGLEGDQYVLPPFVDEAIDLFDHDPLDSLATRWFPRGKDVPIVIDPRFGGGRPTIVGYGITVETIWERFFDGDQDIDFIANDFELSRRTVEEVIRLSPSAGLVRA